jgi:SET domain-containing protein
MLLVKTKIGISKIHGIGVFADEFIPKGTWIWRFQEGFDQMIDTSELTKLSEPAKQQFLHYSYLSVSSKTYILAFDDSRFFNHSDNPNCEEAQIPGEIESVTIAARDIEAGEELTDDYLKYDVGYFDRNL